MITTENSGTTPGGEFTIDVDRIKPDLISDELNECINDIDKKEGSEVALKNIVKDTMREYCRTHDDVKYEDGSFIGFVLGEIVALATGEVICSISLNKTKGNFERADTGKSENDNNEEYDDFERF